MGRKYHNNAFTNGMVKTVLEYASLAAEALGKKVKSGLETRCRKHSDPSISMEPPGKMLPMTE